MQKKNLVDNYIEQKEQFAQEICLHLRDIIHKASPEITEAIKWRHPCFDSKGLLCAIAVFKQHVNFSFFKGKLLNDKAAIFTTSDNNELTSLKFKTLSDIPADNIMIDYLQQAIALNASEKSRKKKTPRRDKSTLVIPEDLTIELANNPIAEKEFNAFSYSKQKDYIDWLTSAKRASTRTSRLATTIEWISAGKSRHWKYENC